MKQINFANKSIYKKTIWSQKNLLFLLIILFLIITVIHIKQKSILNSIHKKNKKLTKKIVNLDEIFENNKKLTENKESLTKKLAKVEKVKNNKHIHCNFFESIQNNIDQLGYLKSLNLSKKTITMTINYPTINKADRLIKTLTDLPYVSSLKLISIHPDKQNLLFKITGSFI